MIDKQFPIGRFSYNGLLSETDRRHAIEQISTLGIRLVNLLSGYSDSLMDTPYRPGGWTARQVIHHLFDSHMNAYMRVKSAITEENPMAKVYNQNDWANLADSKMPVEVSVSALVGLQARLGYLLASLEPQQFERCINHPERGLMSLDNIVAMYAWHGDHHLEHIRLSLHD